MDFYRTSKYELIFIGLILFFSFSYILWVKAKRLGQPFQPQSAVIYQRERLLEEVDLQKDKIITLLNGKMQIEVNKGKIRVLSSDCPQHLCANMGWIQHSGQTIVCVPNQVLVEIKSKYPPLVDAVSY